MLPASFTVTKKDNGLLIRNTETGGSAFVSSAYDAPAEKMLYQLVGALMGEQPVKDHAICLVGMAGSAFDTPETKRAYTYNKQPNNVVAHKLGRAYAATQTGGDGIDAGLGLLKALHAEGFGVFTLGAEYAEPVAQPTTAPTDAPGLYMESGEFIPADAILNQANAVDAQFASHWEWTPERVAAMNALFEKPGANAVTLTAVDESPEIAAAAIKTLQSMGYTYHGAELWKPPIGPSRFPTFPAKLSTDRTCMVDTSAEYQPMATCPVGVTVRLLNPGGVATDGQWDGKDTQWQGWAGMPRVPDWMRK